MEVGLLLTKQKIEKAKYPTSADSRARYVLWDEGLTGFGLRIYPGGKKAFVLSYRVSGRKRLLTLAPFGVWTLDEARKQATIKLGEIAQGKDPLAERQSRRKVGTVGELCAAYMELHSKKKKRSWKEDQRRIDSLILPTLRNVPAPSLSLTELNRLQAKIGVKSIYTANRTIELLRAIFEKGKRWGLIAADTQNPAKLVERFKEVKRDRFITDEEMPRVAAAIDAEESIFVRSALWLYLMTGVRKSELLKLRWSDVDLRAGQIRLRDTKNGSDHFVPLSTEAVKILQDLPREADNPYVIAGNLPGKHLVNISKPWLRVRKRAGVEDVRLHDLRRTVGSWLAQSGASLHLIASILNHKSSDTTKIYARFGQKHLKAALEQHGSKLSQFSEIVGPQNGGSFK